MEDFKWTTDLTQKFIHIRLQNEWLFKKKKQAWKDLHKIAIQNHKFPDSLTVKHMRKKWAYTIDEYHRAVAQNNTSWLYFDIIHGYLKNNNGMEAYSNWSEEWINRLIDIRTEKEKLFSSATNHFDAWNEVECQLRGLGLPSDCGVRKIDLMWYTLLKTYKLKQRFYKDNQNTKYKWPFYESMNNYCESQGFDGYPEIKYTRRHKKHATSDDDSDNECLYNLKKNIMKSSERVIKKEEYQTEEEFRWLPQWTESFIHIRLQNELLFKHNKQPWKQLHSLMMDNGFPEAMKIPHIRKKWSSAYDEYRKAVALKNKNWIYYDLFHSYLGDDDSSDAFKSWPEDWIRKLILIMEKTYHEYTDEDKYWSYVENRIRSDGLPAECSVRNLSSMWLSLKKTFKDKHKYSSKNNFVNYWPLYDDMKKFLEKHEPESIAGIKAKRKQNEIINSAEKEHSGDGFDGLEESHDVKEEVMNLTCRACLGTKDLMLPLFVADTDVSLSDKIMACTSVKVTQKDCLPQSVCRGCANELNAAYKFKQKCEETDRALRTSWLNRQGHTKSIKNELEMMDPITGRLREDYETDNFSLDYYSDNDASYEIMKTETLNKFTNDASNTHNTTKKISTKIKRPPKSKNRFIVPVVTKSGETVYKRKYIYWKVCDICGKSTQKMKEHMKGHSEIKTHKCGLCPKTFTYGASLLTHLKTHDPTPLKVCQLCGREFNRNLTYKRHLLCHANERNFSCETCGKAFNTKDILRIHIRSHTGERPYTCKICSKSFYSKGCVSRHQKVHRKLNPS